MNVICPSCKELVWVEEGQAILSCKDNGNVHVIREKTEED